MEAQSSFADTSHLEGRHGTLVDENIDTIDSEYKWEKQDGNISHVKTSNEKKKEDNRALEEDGMSVLTKRTMMSESTVVLPRVSNDTTQSVKTNSTDPRSTTTEKTATLATDATATINHTSQPPASPEKRDFAKAKMSRFKETNTTEALGYWDLLQSWLPQLWK